MFSISAEQTIPEKSFAGMKKGFLNSSTTSKSKSKSSELIEISPKKTEKMKDFRVLDEVQQVIKEEQLSTSLKSYFMLYLSIKK